MFAVRFFVFPLRQSRPKPPNLSTIQHTAEKAAERFEAQTIELSNKVEDLNRHVNDLAQQRQRLQAENNDLLKEVHDQKVQLDNLQHVKYTLAQQLEEARRRLEDAERDGSRRFVYFRPLHSPDFYVFEPKKLRNMIIIRVDTVINKGIISFWIIGICPAPNGHCLRFEL
ncbi:unnamed protein product [Nippostrongylus brasiliensis]|uniref:Myosin_tail_1 domain-containing protein n=1 Tax=Nippostrongylus brasiliensis TaxID=27835 RepID=A0A0N4XEJ6_NIPBR|nr:unnamed protein product [Nippostrongylus brasiliensis]